MAAYSGPCTWSSLELTLLILVAREGDISAWPPYRMPARQERGKFKDPDQVQNQVKFHGQRRVFQDMEMRWSRQKLWARDG